MKGLRLRPTGRVFIKSEKFRATALIHPEAFSISVFYIEAFEDFFGENNCDEDTILIYCDYGSAMYVDSDCFELVSEMPIICSN